MDVFQIHFFGDISIGYQGKQIRPIDSRSRKIWMLLAYMIYHRKSNIPSETLIDLLWSSDESSSNPSNALKTVFHRLRSLLDQLGEGLGHTLILRQAGSYAFNPEVKVELDIDEFETLFAATRQESDPEAQLSLALQALELYSGNLLPPYSSESWVIPISTYYHNLYLQLVYETLDLLAAENQPHQAVWLCRRAVEIEPYDEKLYAYLMRNLLCLGEQQSAVLVYESLSKMLFNQFCITPSKELRELHRQALRNTQKDAVDLHTVIQDILSQSSGNGALYCEFDFFKAIYSAEFRMVARSGIAMHVVLLSVTAADGKPLAKRSLDRCMENLRPLICDFLRRGDIVSRCTSSQYIILLPNANYENSCLVAERIIRRFGRQYPHSPAFLRSSVQPVLPSLTLTDGNVQAD